MSKSRRTIGIDRDVYAKLIEAHQGQKPAKATIEQLLLIGSTVVSMARSQETDNALWTAEDKTDAVLAVATENLLARNSQNLFAA